MKVLAILAQKGGVGKTTIATTLAVHASKNNQKVVILDTDSQATACYWEDTREGEDIPVIPVPPSRIDAVITASEKQGFDLVVIDGAAVSRDIIHSAASAADFILIPTKTAAFDFRSMIETINVVKDTQKRFAVVFNFVEPQGPEVKDATEVLKSISVDLCPVSIGKRKSFFRVQGSGSTVLESEPDSVAASEMKELYSYINDKLNQIEEQAA